VGRVLVDHRIMGGAPCVRGTRIPVATILGLIGERLTPADVLTLYPQLVLEDVLACEQTASSTPGILSEYSD
jgi:uncharacterized protein (DUF433 family)